MGCIHEHRLTALLILDYKFDKASKLQNDSLQEQIVNFYLDNLNKVNNWDLVDSSASYILGRWLYDKDKTVLFTLARSENLWEKRVSIVSCMYFVNRLDFVDFLKIAEVTLIDKRDLIQKALGWILREMGKKNKEALTQFLDLNLHRLGRTCFRYAIEKFPEDERKVYLSKK